MSTWVKVAEGTSLYDLQATVADTQYPKGTKMKIVMSAPGFEWLFDLAGAEHVFGLFTPDGWDLIDVYGENGQGIVDLEADPAWLLATLAFIKAHWLALTIVGFALALIVSLVVVFVKLPAIAAIPVTLLVGAALGVVGLILLTRGRSP